MPTQVEISESFLPDAVADSVRHHRPQLLMLGRLGTASKPCEVVSSAAMVLLRHVPFPLLIVPTVGSDTAPPRRLALAVDGEPFSLYDNQRTVQQLQESIPGMLHLIHVANGPDDAHTPEQILRTVRTCGLAHKLSTKQVHIVPEIPTVEGILQAASEQKIDMLVVIARRHNLLGSLFHRSITAQLIGESPIPVLLLPALD